MNGLLKGELALTIDIIIGIILGEVITRLRLADRLLQHFMPRNIPSVTALALATSLGSSKAGAAIISSALNNNTLSERQAIFSVLMLPLPAYLRRWPTTLTLSVSMAGKAGMFFALSLLVRSVLRFWIAFALLKKENVECSHSFPTFASKGGVYRVQADHIIKLAKSLPIAWFFFALAYLLVPIADDFFTAHFSGWTKFLPLAGWSVAAGSIAHVSSALALAGGAMANGELSTAQAVFALVLGSGLGTATRILRQNAGYYFGLFPSRTAQKMLMLNFVTIMPLIILNLLFAGFALLFPL